MLNQINQDFVNAVRSTGGNNIYRNLIVGPYYNWSVYEGDEIPQHFVDSFQALAVPSDIKPGHISFEVHAYYNTNEPDVDKRLDTTIREMKTYLMSKNVPVIFSEWGPTGDWRISSSKTYEFAKRTMEQTKANNIAVFPCTGPLSEGVFRTLPAFESKEFLEAILKGYYGEDYEVPIPTINDFNVGITYTEEGQHFTLVDDPAIDTSKFKGFLLELQQVEEGQLELFLVSNWEENWEDNKFVIIPITSTSTYIPFPDERLGKEIKSIFLRHAKEGRYQANIKKSVLLGKDDEEFCRIDVWDEKFSSSPKESYYSYTVNEVVDGNIVRTITGEGTPDSEITVPYHRYNLLNGKLYLKDASGGPKGLEYNHYFTLTENNQVETINYEQTDIQDVVFFAEGEDIPGMTLCDNDNMRVRSSNCLAAYVADGSVGFVTLPAGSYRLTAFIHNSYKDPDSYWKFLAGDKEIANLHCTVVNIQELQSEVFTLNEKTTLYIPQCGDERSGIDLIYITKININYDDDEPEHPDNEFETAAEAVKNMKVGYCLSNTLDAFTDNWIGETHSWQEYETVWGNPITKPEFMKMIRKAGFNAVRVPVTWFPHMDANGKIDETWMRRVHEVVDYVIDQGMYCILNSHHDTSHKDAWLWADDSYYKIQEQYQGLWSQIATEFKDYDEHLLFAGWNEILERQEVFGGESYKDRYKVLNQINQDFVDAVRSSGGNNVFRNLVVGPYYNWSVYEGDEIPQHYIDSFQSLIVPNDINPGHILFEVHAYLKTSDPQVNKVLDRTIQDMNTYLASKKVPIVIGEWGPANEYDNPPQVDAFAHYFMEQTRTNNIATFAWNGPLSYGKYRNLPAFEEPSYIKAIMKGYYGDDYEPVLITTEDYDDEGHRKQFVHTVGFDKIWAELNIFSDDIPLKLKNYKGMRVEFAEPINVDDFGIKVYADNGAVEEGRTPNSSTSATILFSDFPIKEVVNRITLQYGKESKGEAKVVSAWLIRQDDTEEYSDLSPFWGCEITVKTPEASNVTSQYLVNPSFDSDLHGWTNTGGTAKWREHVWEALNNFCEFEWTGSTIANQKVVQTITLPAGSYRLSVTCASDPGSSGLYLIAGSYSKEMPGTGGVDSFSLDFNVAKESAITIGIKVENTTATWVNFDNFKLERLESTTDIHGISTTPTKNNTVIYNLWGQKLAKPQKGINIINGKKVLVK